MTLTLQKNDYIDYMNICLKRDSRILIVKLGAIGDIVHTLPVLSTLRFNLPGCHISWVVEKSAYAILDGNKDIDDIIVIDTKSWRKKRDFISLKEIFLIIKKIRKIKFDIAIDFQGLIKSGVVAYLSGAKSVIGFEKPFLRESFNTIFTSIKSGPVWEKHVIDINLSLLKPLGLKGIKKEFSIAISNEDKKYIDDFLFQNSIKNDKPLIILNPGAGWKTKEWGTNNYALIGDLINNKFSCNIIINWGPGEKSMAYEIAEFMTTKAIISPPTTLKQSVYLLKRANLFIGPDTGPMHIAAAMNTKTVSIFGPSDPIRNGPMGMGHKIIHKPISCSNCYKRQCLFTECMKIISPQDVFNGVEEIYFSLGEGQK